MLTWIVDYRASLGVVGDQGDRFTCLSWALTAAHEFTVVDGPFSVEYLHWVSGRYPSGRGTVVAAAAALQTDGQPEQAQWPYLDENDDSHPGYLPPAAVVGPFSTAMLRLSAVNVDTLVADLESGRLPVVALRITDAFLAAEGGVIGPDGPGADGHAVVAVGIASFTGQQDLGVLRPGDRLVCLRNSWGQPWGVDGHALITEGALLQCALGSLIVDPLLGTV